jgi:hypothetical protein
VIAARAALALWLAFAARVAPAIAAPTETAVVPPAATYVTQSGDTLIALADRALVRQDQWRTVARLNKVGDPRLLPVGKSLAIPSALLRREPFDARISAFSGQVRLDPAQPVAIDTMIPAGTIVETGANSFVTLALADGSKVTLPSQSRLRIDRMDRVALDGRVDRGFTILSGKGDFNVSRRERPADRFLVKTPVAVAAVRGTEFRVAHRPPSSTVTVIEGDVASRALAQSTEAYVGMGRGAILGARDTRLVALLPPPAVINPGRVQDEAEVALEVAAVGASRHVQLARDAGFVDLFAEAESAEPVIRFADVANGTFFARVAAIDNDGIEGLPANYAIERFRTGLTATAETPPGRARHTRFAWRPTGAGIPVYDFILARDAALVDRVVDAPGLVATDITVTGLAPGDWFWQVTMLMKDGPKTRVRTLPVQKLTIAAPGR